MASHDVASIVCQALPAAVRDPTLYIGRMVMFLNMCVFFAIIYVKCRDRVQTQVLARVWLCLWHLAGGVL